MRIVTSSLIGIALAACAESTTSPQMCRGVSDRIENELTMAKFDPAGTSEADKQRAEAMRGLLPKLRQRYTKRGYSRDVFEALGDLTAERAIALAKTCLAQP